VKRDFKGISLQCWTGISYFEREVSINSSVNLILAPCCVIYTTVSCSPPSPFILIHQRVEYRVFGSDRVIGSGQVKGDFPF
jgi:hypothetical protein